MTETTDEFGRLLLSSSRSEQQIDDSSEGESGGTQADEIDGSQQASGPDGTSDSESAEEETTEEESLPKDVQFDILKNRRRRLVLKYLFEIENPVALGTLSEHVAGIENDKDPKALDSQERKRAYVGLYQCHLPRMHDAGVIEFNKDRGLIELGPHASVLEPHIENDENDDVEWARVYLFSSLLGLGVYLITQSSLLGVGWLGPSVLGLTLLVVAAVSTLQLRSATDGE